MAKPDVPKAVCRNASHLFRVPPVALRTRPPARRPDAPATARGFGEPIESRDPYHEPGSPEGRTCWPHPRRAEPEQAISPSAY